MTVCCFSATRVCIPPALIFPCKRMKLEQFHDSRTGTLPLLSESGLINSDVFLEWLKHFTCHSKPTEDDPVQLFFFTITSCTACCLLLVSTENISLPFFPYHHMPVTCCIHLIRPCLGLWRQLVQQRVTNLWLIIQENHCLRYKFLVCFGQCIPERLQLRKLSTVSAQPEFTHWTQTFYFFWWRLHTAIGNWEIWRTWKSEITGREYSWSSHQCAWASSIIIDASDATSGSVSVQDKPASERQRCCRSS